MGNRIPSDGNGADKIIANAANAAMRGGQLAGGRIINPNQGNMPPEMIEQAKAAQAAMAQLMAQIKQQLQGELQAMATSTGASVQGWAMLVEQKVLTPEQCFNFLFTKDYGYPKAFGGDPEITNSTDENVVEETQEKEAFHTVDAPEPKTTLSIQEIPNQEKIDDSSNKENETTQACT